MPTGWRVLVAGGMMAAAVVFSIGKGRVQDAGPLVPEQTIDSVKEDVQWAKTQIGSEKS